MQRRRNEFTVTLPVITKIGERFKLPPQRFGENTVGEVVEIVDQSQGKTNVRMRILSNTKSKETTPQSSSQPSIPQPPMRRNHRRRHRTPTPQNPELVPPAQQDAQVPSGPVDVPEFARQNLQWSPSDFSTPRERFKAGVEQVIQKGGEPVMNSALDLIPRTGSDNRPIYNSPLDGNGNLGAPRQQSNPMVPQNNRTRKGYTQQELAAMSGDSINSQVGKRGGYRRSQYQNKYQRDSQQERIVLHHPESSLKPPSSK